MATTYNAMRPQGGLAYDPLVYQHVKLHHGDNLQYHETLTTSPLSVFFFCPLYSSTFFPFPTHWPCFAVLSAPSAMST
eukprot:1160365-Pelagomonas_calceolata.AAC.1